MGAILTEVHRAWNRTAGLDAYYVSPGRTAAR